MGHIGSELIRILFTLLDLAQHHTVDLRRRPDLQEAAHLLLRQEAGGTVGGVRENVEAAGVADKLVAGEKNVPLFGDKADQQYQHCGHAQSKGRE